MKVSICVITYCQEMYIKDALNGILSQVIDCEIEVIVADDCSPDRTKEIVLETISSHVNGSWINYTRHQINKGVLGNLKWAIQQCDGDFIAICEGDDYWVDQLKLKKQIRFLEENPDFAICYHRVYELSFDGRRLLENINTLEEDQTYTIEDLARKNFIHTPSVVFRNKLFSAFPEWFEEAPVGDYVLHMLNAHHGKIRYFATTMAVYRRHSGSVWSSQSKLTNYKKWIKVLDLLLIEGFSESVNQALFEQRRKCVTIYLNLLLKTDKFQFLEALKDFTQSDLSLKDEWLFIHFPDIISELFTSLEDIKKSRFHRYAYKLIDLKKRLTLNGRSK